MSTANTTAPAPWHPRPADFQREIPIGEICGATVYGLRMWEEKGGEIWHFGARAELNGLDITAYPSLGDGREHLHIDGSEGLDFVGDLYWHQWGQLRELATDPADPVGQLMSMARRFVAEQ